MSAHSDDTVFDELLTQARELGLDELDLDETIYELMNENAASDYNAPTEPVVGFDEETYERLHDSADERASAINNGGVSAQVTAMLNAWGAETTLTALEDIALAKHGE
jgi:hypothetical protein